MLDFGIIDAMESLDSEQLDRRVWRVTWEKRDPLLGGVGGGRWSPPNVFEALYTSFKKDGALSEAFYHLSKAPVFSSSTMLINEISVKLNKVLILDVQTLLKLGVSNPEGSRANYQETQPISMAARLLDYEGVVVPSVRYDCQNLVVFMDKINLDTQLELSSKNEINWPAWKEQSKKS